MLSTVFPGSSLPGKRSKSCPQTQTLVRPPAGPHGPVRQNGWYDDMGRVFIYYTLDEIQEDLNCGHEKAVRLLAELDTGKKGFGLIERVKQGQGRPTKLYVKRFTTRTILPQPAAPQDIPRLPIFGSQDFGNQKSRVPKTEVKTSGYRKCRLPKIGRKLY